MGLFGLFSLWKVDKNGLIITATNLPRKEFNIWSRTGPLSELARLAG